MFLVCMTRNNPSTYVLNSLLARLSPMEALDTPAVVVDMESKRGGEYKQGVTHHPFSAQY